MSLSEIEAELERLKPEELRHLAIKSWNTFVKRESQTPNAHVCTEDDPEALAALDVAIEQANAKPSQGFSADDVRAQLSKWVSK